MSRKQDDICPHCKIGKLSVHPDREIRESKEGTASHRTWLCDNPKCGKTCKDFERENIENLDISEDLSYTSSPQKPRRPFGITILIIFSIVSVVYSLVSWTYFATELPLIFYNVPLISSFFVFFYLLLVIFNVIMIIGLYSGKWWGRKIVLVLGWIGLVTSIISLNPVGILVFAVIVWYLRKSHVKEYFHSLP